jgi:putative pyruvate formate lyase activating enzyme
MSSLYKNCHLCPRICGVDRLSGVKGFCGETAELRIAAASIHYGEEPPITGDRGSGTIFVSGCNLGCTFCQNYQISRQGMGRIITKDEFAYICLILKEKGAENINIVTGSHMVPSIVEGVNAAKKLGLDIPILWNSSGYESIKALSLLENAVDVYLPDLKTLDPYLSECFFAPDYPQTAASAILKMLDMKGGLVYDDRSVLRSGVIIRHLVLPDYLDSTREVLRWFRDNALDRGLLSLMMQYTPVGEARVIPQRYINGEEYEIVLNWLDEFGIEDGFYQELVPDSEWLPDFNRQNPFSSELSMPIWHWSSREIGRRFVV